MAKVAFFDMGRTLLYGTRDDEMETICREVGEEFPLWEPFLLYAAEQYRLQRVSDLQTYEQHTFAEALLDVLIDANAQDARSVPPYKEMEAVLARYFLRYTYRARLYPETIFVLEWFRANGVKLGVVSNVGFEGRRFDALLERFPVGRDGSLRDCFHVVVWSSDVHTRKPDPAIFEFALNALDVSPDDAFHVGDQYDRDIVGAQATGITAVLVDRDGAYDHRNPIEPDYVIRDLREYIPIVTGKRV